MLFQVVVFLGTAVLTVPLFSRLGFGSVLGYLCAGVVIGPSVGGLVSDVDLILHFGEFGVVLLLFVIGLELQPSRLWGLRRPVLGLGGLQVGLSGAVLALAGWLLGLDVRTALLVGLVLGLSSTAMAIQLLSEKQQLRTRYGRAAFSILLFQDMAVIPLLAVAPHLHFDPGAGRIGVVEDLTGIGVAAVVIAGVVVFGRYMVGPFLRLVVSTRIHEIFTAAALFVVVGTAAAMEFVGVSMALGAFLAGVLLSDSEYRHALQADIEPFKGLLLGLFFIAVGMSVNLRLLLEQPLLILGLAAGLLAVKAVLLYAVVGRMIRLRQGAAMRLGVILSQGGEFAFVIFTVAAEARVMERPLVEMLILVVTVSMFTTPLLFPGLEWLRRKLARPGAPPEYDRISDDQGRVIICGFGRVGQIVARVLATEGIHFTALDKSHSQIEVVRRFGNKIYYGDPSRLPVLRSAGADKAEVLILAVDDTAATLAILDLVRRHFPHLKVYARAFDRNHARLLQKTGVDRAVRETFAGSLEIAVHALQSLGVAAPESHMIVEQFREHDEMLMREQEPPAGPDQGKAAETDRASDRQLEDLFARDERRVSELPGD